MIRTLISRGPVARALAAFALLLLSVLVGAALFEALFWPRLYGAVAGAYVGLCCLVGLRFVFHDFHPIDGLGRGSSHPRTGHL
jgi:hypothetical protein